MADMEEHDEKEQEKVLNLIKRKVKVFLRNEKDIVGKGDADVIEEIKVNNRKLKLGHNVVESQLVVLIWLKGVRI